MRTTVAELLPHAKVISTWTMRDVLDYLGQHYITSLEYGEDADSETMAAIDRMNRASAVLYRAGKPENGHTEDCAERALEACRG